jgi:hypothetical protein
MEAIASNKFTTMHLVAEVAIISGMFYYFNKKINKLEKENDHIKKTYVDTFEDVYKKIELLKEGIVELQKNQQQNMTRSPNISSYSNIPIQTSSLNNTNKIQNNKNHKDTKETTQKIQNTNNSKTSSSIKTEVPINVPVFEKIQEELNDFNNISNNLIDFFQGNNNIKKQSFEPAKVEVIEEDDEIIEESKEKNIDNVVNDIIEDEQTDELSPTDFDEINKLLENTENTEKSETKNKTE